MGSTVALFPKITKKKGGTHDTGKRSGANEAPLPTGNHPHSLPDSNVGRADFSNRKALLKQKACQRPKSPYKSRT